MREEAEDPRSQGTHAWLHKCLRASSPCKSPYPPSKPRPQPRTRWSMRFSVHHLPGAQSLHQPLPSHPATLSLPPCFLDTHRVGRRPVYPGPSQCQCPLKSRHQPSLGSMSLCQGRNRPGEPTTPHPKERSLGTLSPQALPMESSHLASLYE